MSRARRGRPAVAPAPAAAIAPRLTRRAFLGGCGAVLLAACGDAPRPTGSPGACFDGGGTAPEFPSGLRDDPFALGVASGDPLPDAVVLWTRLAPRPEDPIALPAVNVAVDWEIAADPDLRRVVRSGRFVTGPEVGHSVHVDVRGLEPGTTYWYRFFAGPFASPIGRTRTAPPADSSPAAVRFGVASCQAYQSGWFNAYRQVADDDLDFVLFVGDAIYELEASVAVRPHGLPPPTTLEGYRRLHGLSRSDPDLRAALAASPWIFTWDDHEVEDNYAGLLPGGIGSAIDPDAAAAFPARRAAAYRAWWEHTPVRACTAADGELRIYRDFAFGDLVSLAVLDDRQYRTPIPSGEGAGNLPRFFGGGPQLPGAFDPAATMLGRGQEAWLARALRASRARWSLLGQQTVMAEVDRVPDDPQRGYSMDAWDGYVAPRDRLLGAVRAAGLRNFVSLGGDIHTSAVTDLHLDYKVAGSPIVGAELIAPSISALELLSPAVVEATLRSPHIHLYDIEHRGWLRCEATREALRADFRYVASTADRGAPALAGTSWVVEDRVPGARRIA